MKLELSFDERTALTTALISECERLKKMILTPDSDFERDYPDLYPTVIANARIRLNLFMDIRSRLSTSKEPSDETAE